MSNTQGMTPGQMKQLVDKAVAAIPSDLTFDQAEELIRAQITRELYKVWLDSLRPMRFKIKPVPDAWKTLSEMKIGFYDGSGPDEPGLIDEAGVAEVIREFSKVHSGEEIVVEILDFGLHVHTQHELARLIQGKGYRPATMNEAVAVLEQCPEISAKSSSLSIGVPGLSKDGYMLSICLEKTDESSGGWWEIFIKHEASSIEGDGLYHTGEVFAVRQDV